MVTPTLSVSLATIGCAAPYLESVSARLDSRGLLATAPRTLGVRRIVLVACTDEERWAELAVVAADRDRISIAVLPELVVDGYTRALALGVDGVVYADTSSAITADVIVAAAQGEVLLPSEAAHAIARLAHRDKPVTELDHVDLDLLRSLSEGVTIAKVAEQLHYSERTVRRYLQNLYLRLGVSNRAEAITAAARLGLLD